MQDRHVSRGTGVFSKLVKEKSERNCQELQWNFNYRIWILAGLYVSKYFVALGNHLLSPCHAATVGHIGNGTSTR